MKFSLFMRTGTHNSEPDKLGVIFALVCEETDTLVSPSIETILDCVWGQTSKGDLLPSQRCTQSLLVGFGRPEVRPTTVLKQTRTEEFKRSSRRVSLSTT